MAKKAEPFPADFDPAPTVFKGGIKRMIEIWETLREKNTGGYGGSVLQQIGTGSDKWQIRPHANMMTSCSPFTATVIGMLFDPSLATSGNAFSPMYDNGTKPLPHAFYSMHQGNYLGQREHLKATFRARGWRCDNATDSTLFFNLGYEVEARDLRRGDLVGIDWSNRGGHAVFVWDVHLDANGDVDAFSLISSNGSKGGSGYKGAGVTIGGCGGAFYISGARGSYKPALSPLFADREEHIKDADWWVIPGRSRSEIDQSTFRGPGPRKLPDHTTRPKTPGGKWPVHVAKLKAVRLWGIRPPTRTNLSDRQRGDFEMASMLAYEDPPASYATGKGAAPVVHIERAPVIVHKVPVEEVKKSPPTPVAQDVKKPAKHQLWVEDALQKLFDAKWIACGPGDRSNVNDAETKAAVKDFQSKFECEPDSAAGPITRKAMQKALDELAAGLPPPHARPTTRKPALDSVVWLRNRVKVGQDAFLSLHGTDLDLVTHLEITLHDKTTNVASTLPYQVSLVDGIGMTPVRIPSIFGAGAQLVTTFSGVGSEGTRVEYKHDVPLYIGEIAPPSSSDEWPWDEARWTQKMRDIVADLRATPAPTSELERWQITQYGVKEMAAGDVEVRGKDGTVFGHVSLGSLRLADIEGTMRLGGRILNIVESGNVYENRETVVDGKPVTKKKPVREKFDPSKSLWADVTARGPWGMGARTPLIPFRTLAINRKKNPDLHYKKVYIKQLDGLKLPTGEVHNGVCVVGDIGAMDQHHFDLCVGRVDRRIHLPSVAGTHDHTVCEIVVMDECAAAKKPSPKKAKKKKHA